MKQKMSEALFKELKFVKDGNVDKDAVQKYVETETKEAFWKPVFKSVIEDCVKTITAKKDDVIKELEKAPFNMKKDQCDVIPMTTVACFHIKSFAVKCRDI